MQTTTVTESLGTRIVSAARMAVAIHLAMADGSRQSSEHLLKHKAMIGGTDRRVTDDSRNGMMNDE
jgi:hypothetical protein